MTTARLWVALALATLVGCSDVEKCLEGADPGCLGAKPDDSGNCRFGLVHDVVRDKCVKPGTEGSVEDAGNGAVREDAAVRNDAAVIPYDAGSCTCQSGQVCKKDGSCVNLCNPAANPPTPTATLLPCRATKDEKESFARIALALCYQKCAHRAAYCGTRCDPESECTQLLASTAARNACQGMDDQSCAINECEKARDLPCAQQQCPLNAAPSCTGVLCSNSCKTSMYNNDGICDDGDPSNAISYACDYGSDCGDCGPRRGAAPPLSLDVGDVCADPIQCGGNLYGVKSSTGWCVPATKTQDYARCVPDCSNNKECAPGFTCFGIADAAGAQFEDYNDGTLVYGCFPSACN